MTEPVVTCFWTAVLALAIPVLLVIGVWSGHAVLVDAYRGKEDV
jgi:hypothetical protein